MNTPPWEKPPVFIVNPVAATCPSDLSDKISAKFPNSRILFTEKAGDGARLAAKAVEQDLGGAIVACGGDGTFREAATEAGGKKPLGIIPAGTVNLMALELGIPFEPEQALDVLKTGRLVDAYPGKFSVEGDGKEHMFFIVLSAGPDADSVHAVGKAGKKILGRYIYLFHFLLRCLKSVKADIAFEATAEKTRAGKKMFAQLMALRLPHYAGKYKISETCSLFDPSMEFIGVESRTALLRLYANALRNKVSPIAGTTRYLKSEYSVTFKPPAGRFQADGDAFFGNIVSVRTDSRPVHLIVPRQINP